MIPRKAIWLLSLLLVIAVFSLISPIPKAQADDEIQGVVADVSPSWMIYTDEDNMSNVDSIWGKHWYFRIVNYTQEDIHNPKVTVETPLELVWLYPSPITTGPPIYEWAASVVPCGSWFLAGGVENEYIVGRPRFSACRSVSPDRLAENITVQTAVVEFKLEEPLPPEVNEVSVVIGFYPISTPHPLTPILVDYTLLTYENTPLTENDEDWEVFLHGTSAIQWYTFSPNSVEIGKTYVVCKKYYEGRYVIAMFLQQNGKFLCRFAKGTDPPTSFNKENLITVEEWKKYEESRKDKTT